MTNPDLQKELKEKVKEGIKPSDLKKLKRSKSADDIPKTPPLPHDKEITQLQDQVKFHAETAANYLKSLQTSQAKVSELEQEVKERGVQNDALLIKLAESYEELNKVKDPVLTELDQSLMARHQNLKSWFSQYQKTKVLDKELKENIEEASNELIEQDNQISSLRQQVIKLRQEKESLTKDLELAHRAVEWRKNPLPNSETDKNYLKDLFYFLFFTLFFYSLINSPEKHNFKDKP